MIDDIPRIGPYVVTSVNIDRPVTSVGSSQSVMYANAPETTVTLQGQYFECIICGEANTLICDDCQKAVELTRRKLQKLKRI